MLGSIHAGSTVAQAQEQVAADLNGETVILGFESGAYYSLDPVGTRIWTWMQEPRTVSDLRDALLREYVVEPDVCERELVTLLEDLLAEGLIEVRNETFAPVGRPATDPAAVAGSRSIPGGDD